MSSASHHVSSSPTASRRRRVTPAGDVRLVPGGERLLHGWEAGMVDVRSAAS
ncbi:predicted protein [Streptomyces lividans TK24]|uniref:Uncharacterized protein n=1 Tax=Streptomyces lividans 1326 TaxID=1200984 RepID=A0A7U9DP48_STRLI|nr:predicted protein [Streptomyces lividans TK24]EOY46770.1 hypothetical protein SLI_2055 [Streptomyces lividans 1326]